MTRKLLPISLFLIAGGLLVQALLAGMFFTRAAGEARMTHIIVGAILPYLAIIPTVSAWRKAGKDIVTRGFARGATLLLVLLWVQEALGHMPFPVSTVIHVPLGVLLFCLSFHLALQARNAVG